MNPELIYSKTAAGEEAMRQRTRVIQRNVRMVLILVDGQSTVADLAQKTGNQQITEGALAELEQGGFIEPHIDQDSIWAESKRVADEIRAATVEKATQIVAPFAKGSHDGNPPAVTTEEPIFVHSDFPVSKSDDSSISPFSTPSAKAGLTLKGLGYPVFTDEAVMKKKPARSARNKAVKPSLSARLRSHIDTKRFVVRQKVELKPVRYRRGKKLGGLNLLFLSLVAFVGVIFALVSLFPYDRYLADAEAAFSQVTERSVRISGMNVDIYPDPGLIFRGVEIGDGSGALKVESVRLQPAIGSLLASKKTFHKVVFRGVTLPAELVAGFGKAFATVARPASVAKVDNLIFEDAALSFAGLELTALEGKARMSKDGLFESLEMHSRDRSANIELKPSSNGLDFSLEGFGWRPIQGSPFLFDSATARGRFENGAYTINSIELRIFDGLIQGAGVLRNDQKPNIIADISFERLNATRLGDAMGIGAQFSGAVAGSLRMSGAADSWTDVTSTINAEGDFSVRRGSVNGIDLAEAVRRVSNDPVQGGQTLFELLSGKVRVTGSAYQFSGLVMNSGLMQSTGTVEISKDLKITGKMDLKMRGSANQSRVPISIGGLLKSPIIHVGVNH